MGILVTEDEADKKIRGAREERQKIARSGRPDAGAELAAREMEISRTAIKNPDPKKAYRLVNRDNKGRVGMLKGYGYKITDVDADAQLVMGEEVEGAQAHGDLVLMETPLENYERRRNKRYSRMEALSTAQLEASKEKINQMARDSGLIGPHQEAAFDESRES